MENAAARKNFVSELYAQAVNFEKKLILNKFITAEQALLHQNGAIHLHDLEGNRRRIAKIRLCHHRPEPFPFPEEKAITATVTSRKCVDASLL